MEGSFLLRGNPSVLIKARPRALGEAASLQKSMADHPPPVPPGIAPVFAMPLQAEGKQSHFAGARGLCAEGGGLPIAVPSNVPQAQPPCAAHVAPLAPNTQHYPNCVGGAPTAPCTSHSNMVQGMSPAPQLLPWPWAETASAAPLRPFAAHAQPGQPPFSQQVHLDAAVGNTGPAFVAQALPARQGMSLVSSFLRP